MRWLDGITILHDVMASHHHHGYKFEQASGVGDGQRSLVCSVYGIRKSRTQTELIDRTEKHTLIG